MTVSSGTEKGKKIPQREATGYKKHCNPLVKVLQCFVF